MTRPDPYARKRAMKRQIQIVGYQWIGRGREKRLYGPDHAVLSKMNRFGKLLTAANEQAARMSGNRRLYRNHKTPAGSQE
ncbi:hypothetical protein GCM10011360_18030 [Primorskyibacter flagellatus]|uniref:Uncharacterized protein n=1 Tax=Primorskyibacter flagellatus TaxID=1387277 RepID=A0A917EES9_9RHOB|nr:hypothetical protein [Primorskyibacter flagellatus]GGE30410.1 hypothetical protein GCM10011360_18030 [Primorskyibacter flagellatus]